MVFKNLMSGTFFWIGINDLDELTACINYAINQPATISYEN